jgi:DNA-binding response OmpR family regulator
MRTPKSRSSAPATVILIVDDDAAIRRLLRRFLEPEGYQVEEAANAAELHARLDSGPPRLVLLDVNLGAENGFDLLPDIRDHGPIPVIFVTGKDDLVDRVVGLELGADDYIVKPFELREVLARIRSVLRRARPADEPVAGAPAAVIEFSGWRLDRDTRTLISPTGEPVELTTGEFDLLSAMAERPNRALSRDQLLDAVKGAASAPFDRSIDTQISRLRRKIEDRPDSPAVIKTVRGVGYMLVAKKTDEP